MVLPLFAVIAPFLVWPIELIFPYPHIVEELAKAVLIFFVAKDDNSSKTTKVKSAIFIGLLFAFSEDVLYLFNIALVGSLETFFERLLLTTFLHVVTSLLILFPILKSHKLLPFGIALAMVLHYLFNLTIQMMT